MLSRRSGCTIEVLQKRAELLGKIRLFFGARGAWEVETPSVSRYPAIDRHLDPLLVKPGSKAAQRFLITSPEYHMKRLLCQGSGSIFQICKAFRLDEAGGRHNPEFTILEWYRVHWDHQQLMQEVDELLQELLGSEPADRLSYRNVFQQCAGLDPHQLSIGDFLECCKSKGLFPPESLKKPGTSTDDRLDFLMGMLIEPMLGMDRPVFIFDYPASQASLARIRQDEPAVSERFEVFYKGMELGNGFHELADATEQALRFEMENRKREEMGKASHAIDPDFIEALSQGLPDCAGVAMGVDRLVMLALGLDAIGDVIPFPWFLA